MSLNDAGMRYRPPKGLSLLLLCLLGLPISVKAESVVSGLESAAFRASPCDMPYLSGAQAFKGFTLVVTHPNDGAVASGAVPQSEIFLCEATSCWRGGVKEASVNTRSR
jgi:hypothetical protein